MSLTIDDLAPNPRNPRRKLTLAEKKGLSRSLEKFGDLSGITFNSRTERLVCGHQRLVELKAMGGEYRDGSVWVGSREYPVRIVDWDEAFEHEASLAANNKHIGGDWDDTIDEYIREIRAGMSDDEFEELRFDALADDLKIDLDPLDEPSGDLDQDAIPEPPADPVTKPGDVWILGDHILVCGDSTDEAMASIALQVQPFIMVTDPPYGVEYDPELKEADRFATKRLKGLRRGTVTNDDCARWGDAFILFHGLVGYVWHAPTEALVVQEELNTAGLWVRSHIVWAKDNANMSLSQYNWKHEACWYVVRRGNTKWVGGKSENTVWEINRTGCGEFKSNHSTQKPLECMARPIRNHGDKSDAVYDPFLGSGTTLIAAEKLGRRCGGLEIDPGYCDVIVQRWEQLTGGQAVRK